MKLHDHKNDFVQGSIFILTGTSFSILTKKNLVYDMMHHNQNDSILNNKDFMKPQHQNNSI